MPYHAQICNDLKILMSLPLIEQKKYNFIYNVIFIFVGHSKEYHLKKVKRYLLAVLWIYWSKIWGTAISLLTYTAPHTAHSLKDAHEQ